MKKVIKNPKKMKNAMYVVFGVFALALFVITRTGNSYATDGLMIDNALDSVVLYGEVETSADDENVEESQDEEEDIPEVDNEEDVDGVQNEDIPLIDNEGDDDSQNVSDNEEDVDETGDEILNSDNTDNEENKQEEKGEDEKGKEQPEAQNPEVPATEEIHGVDDNTPENTVEEDKTQDTDNSKTSEYEQSEIGDFIKDSDIKEIFTTNSTYTIVNQVREEWPNNGLKNFEYGMISIARPSSLSSSEYPIEGFTIMDRNLGATMTGVGRTNQKAYGYHYQWGNNYGFDSSKSTGEMLISSTQVNVSGLTEYTGSTFIKGHETWMKSANNNLWMEGGQGPCPEGWHMPTSEELGNLYKYYTNTYTDGYPRFQNYFYLPIAGKRYYYNGELVIYDYGTYHGYLRSSSPHWSDNSYGVGAYFVEGYNDIYYGFGEYRAQGLSIRCFKNSYAGDTSNFHRINFDYKGGVGSTALVNVINGGTGTKPSDPIKNHSIFLGWYLSGTDTEFDFTSTTINEDLYLYAKWKCEDGYQVKGNSCVEPYYTDTYTIAFDTDGGSEKDDIEVPGGIPMISAKFSHTANIDDNGKQNGNYPTNYNTPVNTNDVVTIDGANRLKVKIIYGTYSSSYDRVSMWKGSHSDYTATGNYSTSLTNKLGGGYHTDNSNKKVYYVDGDTVTFSFVGKSYDNWGGDRYGYYAIIEDVEPNYDLGESPTKEGKVFDGWYKENGEKWDEYTDIVDGDITLYAHWKDPEAILLPGKEFNCQLKNLSENSNSTQCYSRSNYSINNIIRADSIPSGVKKVEIQSEDSNYSIYARYKNGTIYIYSEADKIYLNSDSSYMFYYMYALKDFDIDNLDTSKATDFSYMFNNAQSLEDLNLSGWNTINVGSMSYMFGYCSSLKTLNLNGWDLSNNPSTNYMFNGLYALKTLSLKNWKIPQTMQGGLYQSFGLSNSNALETIDVSNWDLSITTNLQYLFYELYSLKEIIGLNTWDTSNIESMYYTFAYLYNVEDLDGVSNWNVGKVTNMYDMFYNCRSIEELDLSRWDTSKVQTMNSMFYNCNSLERLNLDNWSFENVAQYQTSSMFYYATNLVELGMKNWKLSGNIVNFACNMSLGCMNGYEYNYNKIKEIDVSGRTFSGDSLYDLFFNWGSLEKIEGLDTWDVSNIKNMGNMFYGTYNLKDVDFSGWNTSNVTNMYGMFYNASGFSELDLSNFDTSSVENMQNIFYGSNNLKTIYVGDKFKTTSLLSGENMFSGTTSIVGGNGTVYDPLKFNQEYAKVDTLAQSGYFTNILDKPYNITYNLDNGILSGEKTVYTQRDTFTLKNPIKTGYTFLGWTGSNGNIPQVEVNIQSGTIKGDLEYSANWKINQYTITFDTNGGTAILPITQDYGTEIAVPQNPTKTGYQFSGWNFIMPSTMPAENITITGEWNANIYTVNFYSGGAESGNMGSQVFVYMGDVTNYPLRDNEFEKKGYSFSGWSDGTDEYVDKGNIIELIKVGSGVLNLTAQWKINQYNITFNTDGGNELSTIKLDYNSELINLPTPTKECNTFSGCEDAPERMPAHDITLKAIWNYTCSRSSGGGGSSTVKTNDDKDNHGVSDEEKNINIEKEENKPIETQDNQVVEDQNNQKIIQKIDDNREKDVNIETEVDNTTISNNLSYTSEQKQSYEFAKSNGITTTPTIEKAKMNTSLKRIEMAKMLSYYAINVFGQTPDAEKGVIKFNDVTDKMDKQYDNGVTLAYQLGIMGQNMKNNNFRPNDEVTRAEFVTALSRLVYKTDEGKYKGTGKYYEPHMAVLYNEGIINNTDPKMKEKRGYVMIMLMRTVQ